MSIEITNKKSNELLSRLELEGKITFEGKPTPSNEQAKKMIQERETARKKRDFERADQIRRELNAMGIVLEDTPKGPRWKRKV